MPLLRRILSKTTEGVPDGHKTVFLLSCSPSFDWHVFVKISDLFKGLCGSKGWTFGGEALIEGLPDACQGGDPLCRRKAPRFPREYPDPALYGDHCPGAWSRIYPPAVRNRRIRVPSERGKWILDNNVITLVCYETNLYSLTKLTLATEPSEPFPYYQDRGKGPDRPNKLWTTENEGFFHDSVFKF